MSQRPQTDPVAVTAVLDREIPPRLAQSTVQPGHFLEVAVALVKDGGVVGTAPDLRRPGVRSGSSAES